MLKYSIYLIFFITLFVNIQSSTAQPSDQTQLQQYQKQYPKAKAVILTSEITHRIKFNKKKKLPYIIEDSKETYLALKRRPLSRYVFYDEHSEIKKNKRVGKNASLSKKRTVVCGNYNANGIFYSDAQVCQFPFRFSKEGDTQGLNFTKYYNDPRYFTQVFFTDQLPVVEKKIVFEIPSWVSVDFKAYNFDGFDIQQTKVTQNDGSTRYTFTAKQLPPIEAYDDVPGQTYTYPHLLLLFKDFKKGNQTTTLLGSVDDLYRWYRKVADKVENQPEKLQSVVNTLLKGLETPEQKVKAIFYWVQDNIRYIAFEDGIAAFKPEDAQKVYTKKYGDCKGMANLMKSMLKVAGFDARLTWIGTNRLAYDYSTPSIAVANHMICTLLLNGKKYYLDATEKYIPLGKYAERIQGRPVLIENGGKYWLEKIPVAQKQANQVLRTHYFKIQGESLVGKGKHIYQGEQQKEVLYYLNFSSQKQTKELVKILVDKDDKNCQVDSLRFSSPNQRGGSFSIDYQIKLDNKAASFDNDIYVDLDFYKEFKGFKAEKDRISNLNLREKVYRQSKVTLQIPARYQVKHLPKDLTINHPAFSIQANFTTKNNQLVYSKTITTTQPVIKKTDFAAWNDAIEALGKMYNDQVILTKSKK